MAGLKDKSEIEDYELKAEWLRSTGWSDLWHHDNWIRTAWFNNHKINIDYMGRSTDQSYFLNTESACLLDNYKK